MADITTRPADLADIPSITAIYAESVVGGTASFEVVPPDEGEMARRMGVLVADGYPYFVAERAGSILGFGYAGPYRPRAAYRHTVEDSLYLSAEVRGQGIGGVLLRLLIDTSAVLGFRQMIAVIGDSDHTASIRLHKAAGFVIAGTLKNVGFKQGRWLDSVLMQLELGPGASALPSR